MITVVCGASEVVGSVAGADWQSEVVKLFCAGQGVLEQADGSTVLVNDTFDAALP